MNGVTFCLVGIPPRSENEVSALVVEKLLLSIEIDLL